MNEDWKTADDPESHQKRIRSGFYPDEWFPISHSQIERYELCPRWYEFENIKRLGRESGHAASIGTELHDIQRELAELGLEGTRTYLSAMVPLTRSKDFKLLRDALEQVYIKREYLYSTEATYHWEWEAQRDRDGKLLKVQFEARPDFIFIDPIEGQLEIVDGKSSKDVLPEIDDDPQGLSYSVVVTNLPEFDLFASQDILFTQIQWAKGRTVSTIFSVDKIVEWGEFLKNKTKAILNDEEFKPQTGVHCQWCPFILKCDAGQKKLPELVEIADMELPAHIDNWEDATRIAEGLAYLRAFYLRYEKALAGYMRFAEKTEGWKDLDIPSGKYVFEAMDGRKLKDGITGLLERHPEEKAMITGSWYSRLTLKRKR
jgi:hypothetical protein